MRSRGRLARLFARLLARVRRASAFTRRAVATTLLVVVYVLLLPWFALALRLRRQPPRGWRVRRDPDLTTLPRLRAPF